MPSPLSTTISGSTWFTEDLLNQIPSTSPCGNCSSSTGRARRQRPDGHRHPPIRYRRHPALRFGWILLILRTCMTFLYIAAHIGHYGLLERINSFSFGLAQFPSSRISLNGIKHSPQPPPALVCLYHRLAVVFPMARRIPESAHTKTPCNSLPSCLALLPLCLPRQLRRAASSFPTHDGTMHFSRGNPLLKACRNILLVTWPLLPPSCLDHSGLQRGARRNISAGTAKRLMSSIFGYASSFIFQEKALRHRCAKLPTSPMALASASSPALRGFRKCSLNGIRVFPHMLSSKKGHQSGVQTESRLESITIR